MNPVILNVMLIQVSKHSCQCSNMCSCVLNSVTNKLLESPKRYEPCCSYLVQMALCLVTTVHIYVLRAAEHEEYWRLVIKTRINLYAESWEPVFVICAVSE
jgi:hypothetical protein